MILDYSGDALIKVRLFWYRALWLRSANTKNNVNKVKNDGSLNNNNANKKSAGLCPDLPLKNEFPLVKKQPVYDCFM